MKAKKEKHNEMIQNAKNKLIEKKERLKEIDLENDKNRKLIIKKMQNMEKKKIINDKEKEELYQRLKEDLINHFEDIKKNKNQLEKEEDEIRGDILDYENYKFSLSLEKDKGAKNKRAKSLYRTIETQKERKNEYEEFRKIMYTLQDDSVIKKTDRQRRKLYNEKVRKEREEKKKEEEKKMEEMGLI